MTITQLFFSLKSEGKNFRTIYPVHVLPIMCIKFVKDGKNRKGQNLCRHGVFFHFWGKGVGALWRGKNAVGRGILFVNLFHIFFLVEKGSNSCNTSLKYVAFS
jgi:hypothetical protein